MPVLGQSSSLVLSGNNRPHYSPLRGASYDLRDKKETSDSGALQTLVFNQVPKTNLSEYLAFYNTLISWRSHIHLVA